MQKQGGPQAKPRGSTVSVNFVSSDGTSVLSVQSVMIILGDNDDNPITLSPSSFKVVNYGNPTSVEITLPSDLATPQFVTIAITTQAPNGQKCPWFIGEPIVVLCPNCAV
ncbi:hypothetical protein HK098_001250 [Nowakowskiella sp. JEL0407]|nr:hypothetical protein HK098_001250 [Nowakowskiella sp. JEL0407]